MVAYNDSANEFDRGNNRTEIEKSRIIDDGMTGCEFAL